jgi:hypothetical protein
LRLEWNSIGTSGQEALGGLVALIQFNLYSLFYPPQLAAGDVAVLFIPLPQPSIPHLQM